PPPHGSWSGGPLPPAGRRPPIALPLPPRFPVWRQKWESPNPVDAPEPDGLPSSSLGESFYDPAGLLRLPAAVSTTGSMLPSLSAISTGTPATPPLSGQSLFCFPCASIAAPCSSVTTRTALTGTSIP